YLGDVTFTSDLELATDLVGTEVPPISVSPGPVQLSQAGAMRLGIIAVQNRTHSLQTLSVAPGPQLDTDPSIQVPAGGTVQMVVRAKAGTKAEINDTVVVTGSGVNVQVPVHGAAVLPPPVYLPATAMASATPAPVIGAAASFRPIAARPAIAAPVAAAPAQPDDLSLPAAPAENDDIANITRYARLEVAKVGRNSAELTCDFSKSPAARGYRVEAESIALDDQKQAVAKWNPMEGATIGLNAGTVTATLDGLIAGAEYVVRIVGLDAGGAIVSASSVAEVRTPSPEKQGHAGWVIAGLAILAGGGIWLWQRRKVSL
ncbi:MAG TPA: fibronectin type III domain-containing protein, partial [Chthoniobacteraceae bacterium]|nr:fibronectin type III domain-containing protein [Chthoniobacteraceae bacterium]